MQGTDSLKQIEANVWDGIDARRWRDNQIIIGSKLDAAQAFFAHFLALWLEQSVPGMRCITRVPNGGR